MNYDRRATSSHSHSPTGKHFSKEQMAVALEDRGKEEAAPAKPRLPSTTSHF